MLLLPLLIFIFPLGLDTFGVSLSLGIKSSLPLVEDRRTRGLALPPWLRLALLFALAEMLMPIAGLLIGYALAALISAVMHYIGAFLLVGLGGWELLEEGRQYVREKKNRPGDISRNETPDWQQAPARTRWRQLLLLALSISLDELAVGFSFGSAAGKVIDPFLLCLFISLQGFLLTLLGLALGRLLRFRLILLKEWSELLSAVLLIGLGAWLLFS